MKFLRLLVFLRTVVVVSLKTTMRATLRTLEWIHGSHGVSLARSHPIQNPAAPVKE